MSLIKGKNAVIDKETSTLTILLYNAMRSVGSSLAISAYASFKRMKEKVLKIYFIAVKMR